MLNLNKIYFSFIHKISLSLLNNIFLNFESPIQKLVIDLLTEFARRVLYLISWFLGE